MKQYWKLSIRREKNLRQNIYIAKELEKLVPKKIEKKFWTQIICKWNGRKPKTMLNEFFSTQLFIKNLVIKINTKNK